MESSYIFCNIKEFDMNLRDSLYDLLEITKFQNQNQALEIVNILQSNSDKYQEDFQKILKISKLFVQNNFGLMPDLF